MKVSGEKRKKHATGAREPRDSMTQAEEFLPLQHVMEREEQSLRQSPERQLGPPVEDASQRAERIRRLKEQVQDGSYRPKLRKVAQVILYDDTDSFLGA